MPSLVACHSLQAALRAFESAPLVRPQVPPRTLIKSLEPCAAHRRASWGILGCLLHRLRNAPEMFHALRRHPPVCADFLRASVEALDQCSRPSPGLAARLCGRPPLAGWQGGRWSLWRGAPRALQGGAGARAGTRSAAGGGKGRLNFLYSIWPDRELVRRMRPDAFNPLIAALALVHCSDGRQHVRRAGVERRKKDVPWKH